MVTAAMNRQWRRFGLCREVVERTGLSDTTIYAKLTRNPKRPADYDPTFPRPIRLGARAVGWLEHEIDGWLKSRIEQRRGTVDAIENAVKN